VGARMPTPPGSVLVLNAGSSSLKFSVFDADSLHPRVHGLVEAIGPHARFAAGDGAGAPVDAPDHLAALAAVGRWLDARPDHARPVVVGHRVVHGGTAYDRPVRIDDAVVAALAALTPLAPLHQPPAVAVIRAVARQWPGVAQVACFDTAFHRARPEVAQAFALPREYYERGVRRYGFHGLSYEYIADALPAVAPDVADGRVIVAHLGNGASLCAMHRRRSVDTTMSFSPLDGLPMGTRVGDLDPTVVLHLARGGMPLDEVERLLYTRSGLLGLSGVSGDVRELLARADHAGARFALEVFAFRVAREIAALAGVLGGLDALVFTAGIGEHAAPVRADVCRRLAWLGVALDDTANARHAARISRPDGRVAVLVVPTDEEKMIARHCQRFAK
jgi:acetate kinase